MVIKSVKQAMFNELPNIRTSLNVNENFDRIIKHIIRTNQNWDVGESYLNDNNEFDLAEWKDMTIDYFMINKKRLWYILETIENDFLSIETTVNDSTTSENTSENTQTNSNVDFNGGAGINDKSNTNQNQTQNINTNKTDSTVNKKDYLIDFESVSDNLLFVNWLNMWVVDMVFWE